MSVTIMKKRYYSTRETCKKAGISRSTLFRWIKEGIIHDVDTRDRRGWRMFTGDDIAEIRSEANKMFKR